MTDASIADTTRVLTASDAASFAALRLAGLLESPTGFGSSHAEDFANDHDLVRERLSIGVLNVVFGAFADTRKAAQESTAGAAPRPSNDSGPLVGVIGIYQNTHLKARHKANIWGMYVSPEHRRAGHANRLVEAAISHARLLDGVEWIELGVNSTNEAAIRLYRAAGFECWGREPDALRHAGARIDEDRMALRLDARPVR
jgi:ribosomal protein S18 acetylase RimI-like enzyme